MDITRYPLKSKGQIIAYSPFYLEKERTVPGSFLQVLVYFLSYMEDCYLLVSLEQARSLAGPGCGTSYTAAWPKGLAENMEKGIT